MPLFREIQMEGPQSCFIIDSDEASEAESELNLENNKTNCSLLGLYKDLAEEDAPIVINEDAVAKSLPYITNHEPAKITVVNEDAVAKPPTNNISTSNVDPIVPKNDDEDQGIDDFEFDFQSIDEAEQTEHILKVRVHANFCMRCGTGFVQKKRLSIHLERNECCANNYTREMPLTCSICGRGFFGTKCLREHTMLHAQTKPFKCKKCSRSFVTQRDLYSHYRTHKDYQPFICDLCPQTFLVAKDLAIHRRVHSGQRPYICRLCPKRFNKSRSLKEHKWKHAFKKPFKCKFCWRCYAQNSVRNLHMRTHTEDKFGHLSFLCEICGLTHIRFKSTWLRVTSKPERRQSNDSIVFLGEEKSNAKEGNWLPIKSIIQSQRRESSNSVEILEDPLQFTIDLVNE